MNSSTEIANIPEYILVASFATLAFLILAFGVTSSTVRKMRVRKYRWTQALIVGVPFAGFSALVMAGAEKTMGAYIVWPDHVVPLFILAFSAVVATAKIAQDHEDLITGGERKLAVENSRDSIQRYRADEKYFDANLATIDRHRVLLGKDSENGDPVWFRPTGATHILAPGSSGSGKTHDQQLAARWFFAADAGVIVIDPKADPDYLRRQYGLAQSGGAEFQFFSLHPTGNPKLDALRRSFPIFGYGNSSEATDSFINSTEWESPHYKSIAERGTNLAIRALQERQERPNLLSVQDMLTDPRDLATKLISLAELADGVKAAGYLSGVNFLDRLTNDQGSGLSGVANRCAKFSESAVGDVLMPCDLPEIDFVDGIKKGSVIHISVDVQAYPNLGPQIIAFFLSALSAAAGRLIKDEWKGKALVLIDEMGSFSGSQGKDLLERSRSAGISTWWSPQSLVAVRDAAGPEMLEALIDNCDIILAHRQSSPESAELLAKIAGTMEAFEYTHQVDGLVGKLFDRNTGVRAKRLTDQFRAHPNRIKKLRKGEVLLIDKTNGLDVRFVHVRDEIWAWQIERHTWHPDS